MPRREYSGKGPRGRQKAEQGRQREGAGEGGTSEGVGHQGCEQMEGICFAELNSSAGEVGQNLVGVMSAYLGCLFPGFITFLLSRVLGKVSGLSPSVAVRTLGPLFSL